MMIPKVVVEFINHQYHKDFEPFYVYDTSLIRNHCRSFTALTYLDKSIHFASMANIHPSFLQIIREEGLQIFVNSLLHMDYALAAGFSPQEIIYTASALSERAMQKAMQFGIQVNLDSLGQLERWQRLFPGKKVGIRCNIGNQVHPLATRAGYFIGNESRLGLNEAEIHSISDKSVVEGLHLYVGTDIFDIDYFLDCYKQLIFLSKSFPTLRYLNFGGGFGVSEDGSRHFDFITFNQGLNAIMEQVSKDRGYSVKLILEPGRIIGGEAGFFVCQVNDVKNRPDIQLAGVNASTVQFTRPLFYPGQANHPVAVIRNGNLLQVENLRKTTIYGCSTYSRDIFSNHTQLPQLHPDDILIFGNAGSYLASSYTQFLGFPKPEEYFL